MLFHNKNGHLGHVVYMLYHITGLFHAWMFHEIGLSEYCVKRFLFLVKLQSSFLSKKFSS
jgi:hypothetical protein